MTWMQRHWRGVVAGLCCLLLLGAVAQRQFFYQEDVGVNNAVQGLTNPPFTDATITTQLATIGSATRTLLLPQGAWAIHHDLTIPANVQLWIPTGTTVTIADGQTLTLAGCPRIEAPGWLQPGTTGKVSITAPGCTVEVHKFSTGGAGTDPTLPPPAIASPWTGWDTALVWHRNTTYAFAAGWFTATRPIMMNETNPTNAGETGGYVVVGAGPYVTHIVFAPTADGALFTIGRVGAESFKNVIRDLNIRSYDTTYVKTAIHLIDVSETTVSNVRLSNPQTLWTNAGGVTPRQSIGLHMEGRDTSVVENCTFMADYPMVLEGTPNEPHETPFNLDRNRFSDLYLIVNYPGTLQVAHPNILITPNTLMTRNIFDGIVMNAGSYGIYYHGTPALAGGQNVYRSLFWEQMIPLNPSGCTPPSADLTLACNWGYTLDIELDPSGPPMFDLNISMVSQIAANGIKLRRILGVKIEHLAFLGNGASTHTHPLDPIPLDIGGVVGVAPNDAPYPVTCVNCAAAGGHMVVSPDLDLVLSTPRDPYYYPTNPLPSSALFIYDAIKHTSPGRSAGVFPWTPVVHSDGTDGALTYSAQAGSVTVQHVGAKKLVTFNGYVAVSTVNGAMTGNMYIAPTPGDNFPAFTPSANPVAPVTIGSYANITFAAGHTQLMAFIPQGDQRIVLLQAGSGLGPSYVPIGSMSAGFLLALSGTYVAD